MTMQRILVSGLEPFAGEALNPSMALVEALSTVDINGVELHTMLLPVVRKVADEQLLAAIDELSPTHVLMFGEAGGRAQITPERVAINMDDYRIADNAGHQPCGESVVAGGPVGYFATLPIDAMVAVLLGAGLPASVSNSAGTYLCNRVFYRAMHHIACHHEHTRAGFVHLPYLHEQVQNKSPDTPSMSLRVLISAAEQMIKVIAAREDEAVVASKKKPPELRAAAKASGGSERTVEVGDSYQLPELFEVASQSFSLSFSCSFAAS